MKVVSGSAMQWKFGSASSSDSWREQVCAVSLLWEGGEPNVPTKAFSRRRIGEVLRLGQDLGLRQLGGDDACAPPFASIAKGGQARLLVWAAESIVFIES